MIPGRFRDPVPRALSLDALRADGRVVPITVILSPFKWDVLLPPKLVH